MKTKHILSTAAVLAVLASGATLTAQEANAQSANQAVSQIATNPSEISSVYFKHYNVLRAELKTPISENDYYVDLALGINFMDRKIVNTVSENGYYIGFDFNLDELVKKYPSTKERETLVDSLLIRSFAMDGLSMPTKVHLTSPVLKKEILDYKYTGDLIKTGYAEKVSNLVKGNSFNTFFKTEAVYGDHTLTDGRITTKTGGLQFKLNPSFETGYTYSVTTESGNTTAKIWIHQGDFFFKTYGKDLMPKKYIITATSNKTGDVYTLASFTPFNIF